MTRRTTALRRLVGRSEIAFLMEAHNGLSARIVEEAGFRGHLGERPHDVGRGRCARQQRALLEPGGRPGRLHGGGDIDPRPARRRHWLRQLQQHAPPRAQARAGRGGRRHHRGQALPQDELVLAGRAPSAGRHRRVLRQDQGRQGQPGRFRLRAGGPGGGAHRRLGARRGPPAGRGLSPRQAPTRS